ncbi:hypothetical protein WJX72_002614 [[Myrmecia] bisecta]|uniref:Uncharacterized protein n=1 Tax=[Myrmecia] bisecta TaxID=41462 RepID=A0AAW1PKF9_9CHLO
MEQQITATPAAVSGKPEDSAQSARLKGNAAFATRNWELAYYFYTQALCSTPQDAAALLANRSASCLHLGDPKAALQDAEAAVQARPRWFKAHYRCGRACESLGQLREAADCYRRACELDPQHTPGLLQALAAIEQRLADQRCRWVLRASGSALYDVAYRPQVTAFGRQAEIVAAASADCKVYLWDPATGELQACLTGHIDLVTDALWSANGLRLASASLDCTARIWAQQQPAAEADHDRSTDCTVRLWNAASGACLHTLAGHSGKVADVAMHPSRPVLASASGDGNCRVWDTVTGSCLHELTWDSGGVNLCRFTARAEAGEGLVLATCHIDGPRREMGKWLASKAPKQPMHIHVTHFPLLGVL